MTAPMRRSPRLAMPSASVALGSCHFSCTPLALWVASRSSVILRRSSSTVFWPNHWNGVCGLGTNPPTLAVMLARLVYRRPIATQLRASSAIPSVSASVSVGSPVRKYSFIRVQPLAYADSTAPYRSSSVISLLITLRSRHDPASGANVNPLRRAPPVPSFGFPATRAASPTVNASTRSDGRLIDVLPHAVGSLSTPPITSSMPLKSALDSDVRATSCWPVRRSPSVTIVRTCSAGRSRTGRVIIPAWQNRHPRVQPRNTSTDSRSCTTSVNGASGDFGYGHAPRSATVRLTTSAGTSANRGLTATRRCPSYSTS